MSQNNMDNMDIDNMDMNNMDEGNLKETDEMKAMTTVELEATDGIDHFNKLPDEIIMHIFQLLPKQSLLRCHLVSKRFYRCAMDEYLWTHVQFMDIKLKSGVVETILKRGVKRLCLERTPLIRPVFDKHFLNDQPDFESKLLILDLRRVNITKPSLILLLSVCPSLKELHLESIPINDDVCIEISKLSNLLCLNLINCGGIEARGVRKMLGRLHDLCYLNMLSSKLSIDAVTALSTHITSNILRLHIGGCRKTMFDSHLRALAKRCPRLLELSLTDCRRITENALLIICTFKQLRGLSLTRCYAIGDSVYIRQRSTPTFGRLRVFGALTDRALNLIRNTFTYINVNEYNVIRPTVRQRRASI